MKLLKLYQTGIEKKRSFRDSLSCGEEKKRSENLINRMGIRLFFSFPWFFILFSVAADTAFSVKEEVLLESTELKVRKTFPLYKVDFNHKAVQEEVYNEFMKELKEKEQSEDTSSKSVKKP
ncbi:MAG: hypothetical protein OXM55_04770 [Bdellovibrionales bacterium]|nr:hypothetical protein [Bdellovibrionales bacterium]